MYIKLLENRELSFIWNRVIFQSLLTVCMLNLYARQRTSKFNVKLFCKSLITSNQCLSMCLSEMQYCKYMYCMLPHCPIHHSVLVKYNTMAYTLTIFNSACTLKYRALTKRNLIESNIHPGFSKSRHLI